MGKETGDLIKVLNLLAHGSARECGRCQQSQSQARLVGKKQDEASGERGGVSKMSRSVFQICIELIFFALVALLIVVILERKGDEKFGVDLFSLLFTTIGSIVIAWAVVLNQKGKEALLRFETSGVVGKYNWQAPYQDGHCRYV
jgi:hypothetical protein